MAWNAEIQRKYDDYLIRCANENIQTKPPVYFPRLIEEIYAKTVEYNEAMQNTGSLTKSEWLSLTSQLKAELDTLVAQDNAASDTNVETAAKYQSDWIAEQSDLMSNENVKWSAIRLVRADLLYESDWTQLGDCPLSEQSKTEWANYRRVLRDIPETYANVESIEWPTKPV